MNNFTIYKDQVAVHPGYYVKELVDESGLTQEDFAKHLDTSPKTLSLLIRGEQSITVDLAIKLSRMIGTSVEMWLNLQNQYDTRMAMFKYDAELDEEKKVLEIFEYKYFVQNYNLPRLSRKINEQIVNVRQLLQVSSLTVLENRNLNGSYRLKNNELKCEDIVKNNVSVQMALNKALNIESPSYNKKAFEKAVDESVKLLKDDNGFDKIKELFYNSGVVVVTLPNMKGLSVVTSSKKLANKVVLMVQNGKRTKDFWYSFYNEVGNILFGEFGLTINQDLNQNSKSNQFAVNKLAYHL